MTQNERRIVTLTLRFMNAVDRIRADADESYAFDSRFDGGEFCGPAIRREQEERIDERCERFGLTVNVAHHIAMRYDLYRDCPTHVAFGGVVAPLPR